MTATTQPMPTSMFDQMLFPTDLEGVLMETVFPTDMLMRAAICRQQIIMDGLTRLNARGCQWRRPVNVERVILVVGQVESDSSLKHGAHSFRTNLSLLQAVCQAHADAYIVYKPHPEVWSQMRTQDTLTNEIHAWCDECVGDVPLSQLLPKVNEVHVMTSLAGFEALLRGKKVSCYGHAFYAGWGLTSDMVPMPQRSRRLSIDELVAGALFSHPRYMGRHARKVWATDPTVPAFTPWKSAGHSLSVRT